MSLETVFLDALREDPTDQTTALMFADWLEERGDSRGELLRIQTLASDITDVDYQAELQLRQEELLADLEYEWLGPLQIYLCACRWDGVFADISVDARHCLNPQFLSRAQHCLEKAWIGTLRIRNLAAYIGAVARGEWLSQIASLDLSANNLSERALRNLVTSPHLSGVRRLNLSDNRLWDGVVEILWKSSFWGRLMWLDLSDNWLSVHGAYSLLNHWRTPNLRWLNLKGNGFDPTRVQDLDGNSRCDLLNSC